MTPHQFEELKSLIRANAQHISRIYEEHGGRLERVEGRSTRVEGRF